MNQNIMIQIIIKLIEFFLNPGLIPSQRDQMPQKLSLIFIKSMLENIKWCINARRASCLLSKYYVINYFQSKKNMISLKQENMKNTSLAARRANSGGSWEPSSQKLSELAEIIG